MLSTYTGTVPVLTEYEDQLLWRWSTNGVYSAASLYKLIVSAGKIGWNYMEVWTSAAPSKVKIFTFLLLSDQVLTHDLMQR